MRAVHVRRLAASLALLLVAACGARSRTPASQRPIDALREHARQNPSDRDAWSQLAIGEHLEDGGDPEAAREALRRAQELGGRSLRLDFIAAEEHVLEGRPAAAFASYAEVLRRAAGDEDPLAPLLAEAAVQALTEMNDALDDYRTLLRSVLEEVRPRADALGLTAAHQLRMLLLQQALAVGDLKTAEQVARDAGCVQKVEVAGPFGPRELLGFDRTLEAEKPGPLAAEYDLGKGRGKAPTRRLETRRCVLGLGRGAHDPLAGTSVVRAELEVPSAGAYALRFESPNSAVVWLNGEEVLRADLRQKPGTGPRYVPLSLEAGKHELKVKISSRHPNPAVAIALVPAQSASLHQAELPAPRDAFTRYLAAKVALSRGNGVGARELLRELEQRDPTTHWLVLQAAAALADPLRPAELRRDWARDLLRKAGRRNAAAWYPTVGLANLEAAEGRSKEALEALREAERRWPEVVAIRTSLIEQLRDRGYVEEADRRVAELERVLPRACAVTNIALGAARSRGRMEEVARLTERVMACDATSTARFMLYKVQRKYDQAAEELVRLRSLADPVDDAQRVESELEQALISGDVARQRALREERSQIWFDRPGPVLDRADMLVAAGDRAGAIRYLSEAIEKSPHELYELRRVHEALGGAGWFEGFRKDGAEVIRAYEASGKQYQEPQVLVLDYTVVRVFEDGSSVDLTHNIMRVQSQEAVDESGEFSLPDGARLLALHTVKADGTRLEPDAIAGKDSLSLPNLSPNDYVEFEMVRGEGPSSGFPGGYLGNRFYFKSFEVPFHHSELVVLLPPGMEPVIDPRGPAPETLREEARGLTVLRWVARDSEPLSPEPLSVASREFLPSINLGVKVSWEAYVESLRDVLSDKDIVDPEAKRAVATLLEGFEEAPVSARAQRLYRWVTDQIEPTDEVFGQASAMLAARTGHRERILHYLYKLADIPSELVLVRGVEADHSEAKLPDPETYGYLLLRVHTEQGPKWLHAGARHAPFGYLPPQVRGEIGLVLNEKAERVRTPDGDLEQDLRSVEAEIVLTATGAAEVRVRETHRGPSAIGWRNDIEEIPEAELEARFEESYAANVVAGARLKRLSIEGRDDPEKPLVVAYDLEVASLGQRTDHEQRIPTFLPSMLAGQYARLSTRSTTQIVAPAQAVDVHVRFVLPQGAKLLSAPSGEELTHAPVKGRFVQAAEVQGGRVDIRRSLRLSLSRVEPEQYPEFAEFCRAVDRAEARDVVVKLP